MSEEEIKKNIERIVDNCNCWIEDKENADDDQIEWAELEKSTVLSLLDLYNKQKENAKKLARAIMFMGTNPDITEEEAIKAFTENPITEEFLDKFRKDYISKDKIRELIEKWKNEEEWDLEYSANEIVEILEELLEE